MPKDFGTKALTWTIVANGEKQSIPFTLNKGYPIAPYKELGMGNAPPVLAFAQGGAKFTGPPVGIAATYTGRVNEPLTLNVWVEDPKAPAKAGRGRGRGGPPPVATVSLHKFRGPGEVTFDKAASAGHQAGRDGLDRGRLSTPRANTSCACRPTTSRARAAPASSAAGPMRT